MMSSTSFSVVTSFKGLTGKGFADFGGNTGISIIGNCVSAASQPEVLAATTLADSPDAALDDADMDLADGLVSVPGSESDIQIRDIPIVTAPPVDADSADLLMSVCASPVGGVETVSSEMYSNYLKSTCSSPENSSVEAACSSTTKDFDHMYASLSRVDSSGLLAENCQLKAMLVSQLDLIQQQSETIISRDKQLKELRVENEQLRMRLTRMERRIRGDTSQPTAPVLTPPKSDSKGKKRSLDRLDKGGTKENKKIKVQDAGVPSEEVPGDAVSSRGSELMLGKGFSSDSLESRAKSGSRESSEGRSNLELRAKTHESSELRAKDGSEVRANAHDLSELRVKSPGGSEKQSKSHDSSGQKCKSQNSSELQSRAGSLENRCEVVPPVSERVRRDKHSISSRDKENNELINNVEENHVVSDSVTADGELVSNCLDPGDGGVSGKARTAPSENSVITEPVKSEDYQDIPPRLPGSIVLGEGDLLQSDYLYYVGCKNELLQGQEDQLREVAALQRGVEVPRWRVIPEYEAPVQNKSSLNKSKEVPEWRHRPMHPCYTMEGTENIEDENILKRHSKHEKDEKQRKRWDIQRLRQAQQYEKLRASEARRGRKEKERLGRDDTAASLLPTLEDATHICVSDTVPITAFGRSLPHLPQTYFFLPWLESQEDKD